MCVIWGVGVSTLRCGGWRTPSWRWFPPSHIYTCSRLQLRSLGLCGKCFPLQSHLADLDPGLVSLFEIVSQYGPGWPGTHCIAVPATFMPT